LGELLIALVGGVSAASLSGDYFGEFARQFTRMIDAATTRRFRRRA